MTKNNSVNNCLNKITDETTASVVQSDSRSKTRTAMKASASRGLVFLATMLAMMFIVRPVAAQEGNVLKPLAPMGIYTRAETMFDGVLE